MSSGNRVSEFLRDCLHRIVELPDDLAGLHLDRDRDRAMFRERRIGRGAIVDIDLERDGRFVHPPHFEDVAQVNRRARFADTDHRA